MIIDLFAGPGGWEEGLKILGDYETLGIEIDDDACATAMAAGHPRLQADVLELNPHDFECEGLIASPPCQPFSKAGQKFGSDDRLKIVEYIRSLLFSDASPDPYAFKDNETLLTVEPLKWVLALKPEWVAMEQVPAVLDLWVVMAGVLEEVGYQTDVGYLWSEQFGVPQVRKRAYLVASLNGDVYLPDPTHQKHKRGKPNDPNSHLKPWVTMYEALGWGLTNRPAQVIPATSRSGGGPRPLDGGSGARKTLADAKANGTWITKGSDCDPHKTIVDTAEIGVLQGFRKNYPWKGNRTKQFQQVGNAVCPPVGAAVLKAAMAR